MSGADSQTPKSAKRRREDKREVYTSSKKQILDRVRQELRLARIRPITRIKGLPNHKFQMLCQATHVSDGNDERILSISEGGIVRFHIGTVEVVGGWGGLTDDGARKGLAW